MLISKGSVSEYNEMMAMSVEDFLIRFKIYINDIEDVQKINSKIK